MAKRWQCLCGWCSSGCQNQSCRVQILACSRYIAETPLVWTFARSLCGCAISTIPSAAVLPLPNGSCNHLPWIRPGIATACWRSGGPTTPLLRQNSSTRAARLRPVQTRLATQHMLAHGLQGLNKPDRSCLRAQSCPITLTEGRSRNRQQRPKREVLREEISAPSARACSRSRFHRLSSPEPGAGPWNAAACTAQRASQADEVALQTESWFRQRRRDCGPDAWLHRVACRRDGRARRPFPCHPRSRCLR